MSCKEVIIESNKTIEVVLNNKEQLEQVNLGRKGCEYGSTMFNQSYKLDGSIAGVCSTDGKKIGTMMTDTSNKVQLLIGFSIVVYVHF